MAGAQGEQAECDCEHLYLWPCNVAAWQHWQGVQTQWRTGMGGREGLDYQGVCAYLDELGLQPGSDDRRAAFDGIRAAERGTLLAWQEARDLQPPTP